MKKYQLIYKHMIFCVMVLFTGTTDLFSQINNLEFAKISGDGNPAGNGPVVSTTINFLNNTTGNTFTLYNSPVLSATIAFTNQQYDATAVSSPAGSIIMGHSGTGGESIFSTNAWLGSPSSSNFTSVNSTAGTGISVSNNYAVSVRNFNRAIGNTHNVRSKVYVGRMEVTFSRAVSNPIIHLSGLYGRATDPEYFFSTNLDLNLSQSIPTTGLSLTRLSGTSTFALLSANSIGNNFSTLGDNANGSVRINGTNIQKVSFDVYLDGYDGNPNTVGYWTSSEDSGDAFGISFSVSDARPSVTGTVYIDNNGNATIDGGGTGGGVWTTSNTLYVNAIGTNGNVVAIATVANTGVFTFPAGGNLFEGQTLRFQLSKNQGIVGQPAPAKELPNGWMTVGESINSGPNDGTANSEFTLTIGTANSANNSTNRFGVTTCAAGTIAPVINTATNYSSVNSAYNIPCGSTTANLIGLTSSNKPTSATVALTWHTATPATTANKITNVTALTGTTKYYASFFDSVNNCYSPTKEIIIYAPICATNDNFIAIPITHGVGGTLPSIFANDTYNGATISTLPPMAVELEEVVWVHANAQVDIAGNGSLYIPPSTPVGTYTYTYSITDKDPDGIEDSNASYATVTFKVIPNIDSDGDGINDDEDVDDDNDGILDTTECNNTITDMANTFGGGTLLNIVPSDLGLALNAKRQNITRDLSAKFGYPANSGAVIITITNASVHPTSDAWWTKNGEQPSIWNVTGTMSAFVLMVQNPEFYGNDSKTIHIYDAKPVIPITLPGMVNQTTVAGQWSIGDTSTQKTLNDLDSNTSTNEYGNWRFANMNFGAKSFGFSTTTAFGEPTYAVMMYLECDSDDDGIPNRLDLDSDDDGCADAIEGGANITNGQLVTAGGTVSGGSTSVDKNLCAGFNCVGPSGINIGLPQFATLPTGYSNTTGQTVGQSQNAEVSNCYCTQPPSTGTPELTKVGISVQQKQTGWPENIPNGHIALESKEKGFVITRVPHVSFAPQPTDSIADPFAGMLVYDLQDSCVKLFNGINWKCIQRSCNDTSN